MTTLTPTKIETFVDRVFLKMATQYRADNSVWAILANKRHRTERNLKVLKTLLPAPHDLGEKETQLAEYLWDLAEQEVLLRWFENRRESELNFDNLQDSGQYIKLIHDSFFIHGFALIDKASRVVTNSMINRWADNADRTKSELKMDYSKRFKAITGAVEEIRHSFLHGQGGEVRPDSEFVSQGGYWPYLFALDRWPPRQPINYIHFNGELDEYVNKLGGAASGTREQVGDILHQLADELQV